MEFGNTVEEIYSGGRIGVKNYTINSFVNTSS